MPVPQTAAQTSAPQPASNMASMLRRPTAPLAGEEALAMSPGHPFFLKHHWNAWEVASDGLDEATWLPQIKRHTLRPGVNGTRTIGKNERPEAAYDVALRELKSEGWTVLEQYDLDVDHRPAGVPEGPYCREAPARDPRNGLIGSAYLEAWQVPLPTMPGDEEGQKFQFDRASYNRWRLWLVESGQIAPPQKRVLDRLKRTYEARVPAVKVKRFPTEAIAANEVAAAQELAALHTNAQVPEGPAPVKPPPPKAKKPKAEKPADTAKAEKPAETK